MAIALDSLVLTIGILRMDEEHTKTTVAGALEIPLREPAKQWILAFNHVARQ
jgi:hypothetical protein